MNPYLLIGVAAGAYFFIKGKGDVDDNGVPYKPPEKKNSSNSTDNSNADDSSMYYGGGNPTDGLFGGYSMTGVPAKDRASVFNFMGEVWKLFLSQGHSPVIADAMIENNTSQIYEQWKENKKVADENARILMEEAKKKNEIEEKEKKDRDNRIELKMLMDDMSKIKVVYDELLTVFNVPYAENPLFTDEAKNKWKSLNAEAESIKWQGERADDINKELIGLRHDAFVWVWKRHLKGLNQNDEDFIRNWLFVNWSSMLLDPVFSYQEFNPEYVGKWKTDSNPKGYSKEWVDNQNKKLDEKYQDIFGRARFEQPDGRIFYYAAVIRLNWFINEFREFLGMDKW
jgi:hypothetical protein